MFCFAAKFWKTIEVQTKRPRHGRFDPTYLVLIEENRWVAPAVVVGQRAGHVASTLVFSRYHCFAAAESHDDCRAPRASQSQRKLGIRSGWIGKTMKEFLPGVSKGCFLEVKYLKTSKQHPKLKPLVEQISSPVRSHGFDMFRFLCLDTGASWRLG